MNKRLVPEIRFKGYDGEWEEIPLSNPDFNIQAGGDIDKNNIKSKGKYPVIANALTNKGIVGYYNDSFRVYAPAVSVTGRGDVGIAVPRRTNFTPVVRLLTINSSKDIDFLACAINNYPIVLESTGVPQLTVPKLQSYKILFPPINEQLKIGEYFKKLDGLISDTEKKIERLERLKTASLQKMFPQAGENTPKIRFNGFTEPWEEKSFEDVFSFLKNNTLSRADLSPIPITDIRNIHYGDILVKYGEIVDPQIDELPWVINIESIELTSKSLLQTGDVIFADTAEDETVGKCIEIDNIVDQKIISGLHTIPVRPKIKFSKGYLSYFFNAPTYHSSLLTLMQGVKVLSLSKSAISNTLLLYPENLEEQKAIGDYFQNLDNIISEKKKMVAHLRNLKKACLSKMFVNTAKQ